MTPEIALDDVRLNPRNPRETVRDGRIDELAESIEQQGLLQAVTVRPVSDGYELVHGERRYRAVSQLGWETLRAEIRDLSDREALEASVTENLQREDVTAIAEAQSYRALIDEFGLTQTEAADRLGISQSHISNRLKLLELPEELQENILHQIFTPWQARELARVWGEYWICDLALDHGLSVSELRDIVHDLKAGADVICIEKRLSKDALGEYWGEPDDAEHQTWVEHGTDHNGDKAGQPLGGGLVDSRGDRIKLLPNQAVTHGLLWIHHNVAGFDCDNIDKYDEWEPRPIKIHWPAQRIIQGFGYHRLRLAEQFDYTGELEVELLYPSDFLRWERRRPEITPPDAETGGDVGEA
jgi:ParB/RepB/Spo0J family partition protein